MMSEERQFTTSMGKLAGIAELNNRFKFFLGEEEPNPTYPFMLWARPSLDAIYMRRVTNDAWIKIASLSGIVEQIKPHTHVRSDITDFNHTHNNATTSAAGFMSTTDKSKLDAITIEKIAVGSYTGNGSTSWRNISVGFSPNMVIVGTSGSKTPVRDYTPWLWLATSSGTTKENIEVTSTGFRVRKDESNANPNVEDETFRYCAIR